MKKVPKVLGVPRVLGVLGVPKVLGVLGVPRVLKKVEKLNPFY
jgi:hypothetical protein